MIPFSQNSNFFSWSAPPMVGAAISLVVSACSVDDAATRTSLPPPDVSESVAPHEMADDDSEDAAPAAEDLDPTKGKPTATDDGESESDENVSPVEASGCRTLDDCDDGLVCVIKNDQGVCEKGVMLARGPLNQPPPPFELLNGGLNRSEAQ